MTMDASKASNPDGNFSIEMTGAPIKATDTTTSVSARLIMNDQVLMLLFIYQLLYNYCIIR